MGLGRTKPAGPQRCRAVLSFAPMPLNIPAPILFADRVHHDVLTRVHFSSHLNPSNIPEAKARFLAGQAAPPFVYEPLVGCDALLRTLDEAEPPRDHPAGALVGACIDGTRLLLRALRDRSAAAFDAMNQEAGWYPPVEALALSVPAPQDGGSPPLSGAAMMVGFRRALALRGLGHWTVVEDPVMSARVLVDSAKSLIRINSRSTFRQRDLRRLVAHEVDVHVVRSRNGEAQALRCFQTGLPRSLATEEGLAVLAEERVEGGVASALAHQVEVLAAIEHARGAGFREVYTRLERRLGPGLAWSITTRIKRGLAHPELPGVYAKDSVYLLGYLQVKRWLAGGGRIDRLYVGKVAVDHPVEEWLEAGWVHPQPVPSLWTEG